MKETLRSAHTVAVCFARVTSLRKRGAENFLLLFYLSNLLHRTPDELHQVGLYLLQRWHMDIHHMPGFVISHADVLLQALIQTQMVECIFSRKISGLFLSLADMLRGS